MKKPKIENEEQQPRKIIRADKAPTEGYSLVVDGHFKSHHDTVEAADRDKPPEPKAKPKKKKTS